MRARLLVLVIAAALAAAVAAAPSASAHSTLIRSCPAPGDVLNELDVLELEFSSPLIADDLGRVDLIRSTDEFEPAVGPVVFSEDLLSLTVEVLDELEPGSYILRYRVTSADGDENDGGHQFTLDPDARADSDICDIADSGGGAGGLVLLGIGVVAVGALLFFLRPRRTGAPAAS